jgi:hypothetical protein
MPVCVVLSDVDACVSSRSDASYLPAAAGHVHRVRQRHILDHFRADGAGNEGNGSGCARSRSQGQAPCASLTQLAAGGGQRGLKSMDARGDSPTEESVDRLEELESSSSAWPPPATRLPDNPPSLSFLHPGLPACCRFSPCCGGRQKAARLAWGFGFILEQTCTNPHPPGL